MRLTHVKIDEKRTKKVMEKELLKYRDYLLTLPVFLMPTITPSYSIVPPSNTNEFNSKTENAAIERILYESERTAFMEEIHEAVDKLKHDEKQILLYGYLMEEKMPDVEIWTMLHIGKTKFYEIKSKAFLRLAFHLKKEVYNNKAV